MTDREILSNAINKAIVNGWNVGGEHLSFIKDLGIAMIRNLDNFLGANDKIELSYYIRGIILSHSFAKAFWGEEYSIGNDKTMNPIGIPVTLASQTNSNVFVWQYHLQQMVLCENPIAYLEKFL